MAAGTRLLSSPHPQKARHVMAEANHPHKAENWDRQLEGKIRTALSDIRFGTVTLIVQDGQVIQIEKNEKIRLK